MRLQIGETFGDPWRIRREWTWPQIWATYQHIEDTNAALEAVREKEAAKHRAKQRR